MALPIKGQICQRFVPMVDKTDFATIESGVVASNCTAKFYGCNNEDSTFTSGTVSKALSVVRSGILRCVLKTTENNYDHMMLRVTEATVSCADQILTWDNRDVGESDAYSMLSDLKSNIESRVPKEVASKSLLSDVDSNLLSYLAGMSGMLSDVDSQVNLIPTTALSAAIAAIPTDNALEASDLSDLRSAITAGPTDVQLNASSLSDLRSAMVAACGSVSLSASDMSDIRSAVAAVSASLSASDLSDIRSAIAAAQSDINSHVSGITAGLDASDISDIASAVQAILASRLSDTLSAAQQANSRALVIQSMVSDMDSQVNLVPTTDLSAAVAAIPTTNLSAAVAAIPTTDLSAAVAAIPTTDLSGALSQADSVADDIYSMLSDLKSNIESRVPKEVASKSLLSDVHSDLRSYLAGVSAALSDVESKLDATDTVCDSVLSRVTLAQSNLSDVESQLDVTASKVGLIQSNVSDIESQLDAGVNAVQIAGSADAASRLSRSAQRIVCGTASAGTLSTTEMTCDLAYTDNDSLNGRLITFDGNVTAALADIQTNITDHDAESSPEKLTFTAIPAAMAAGDTFVIT